MTHRKLENTSSGWVFALSDQSGWGSPDEFIADFGLKGLKKNSIEVETTAWGKLPKQRSILPGEGIAFYHTTRAYYGPKDKFRRRPRITMVGVLKNLEVLDDTDDMEYRLIISFEKEVVNRLIDSPIIRDESTRPIFEDCGMVQGSIKTWYEAPPVAWKEIVKLCLP